MLMPSDANGIMALIWAAGREHAEVVEMLLKYGANPDLADTAGRTALMIAVTKL